MGIRYGVLSTHSPFTASVCVKNPETVHIIDHSLAFIHCVTVG